MPPAPKARIEDPERLVSAARVDDDDAFELKLRPKRLAEFIGQTKAKEQLAIALEAAKSRGEALDHVLLFGPPGLGKTTLATIIANELDVGFQQTSGPALQIQGDLTAILTNLRERQVLFLDEIHRLQPVLEEKLYTALEDYKLDIIIGQGPAARTHVMEIKPLHLRRRHHAPRPALARRCAPASASSCASSSTPTKNSASSSSAPPKSSASPSTATAPPKSPCAPAAHPASPTAFCAASATTPRSAPPAASTAPPPQAALKLLEVDAHGFDELDRRLLRTIIEKYDGGPVGLNTLAAALAEEQDALEEVYEPFLIQIGFLDRTPRGRVATRLAYEHFGLPIPRKQPGLF